MKTNLIKQIMRLPAVSLKSANTAAIALVTIIAFSLTSTVAFARQQQQQQQQQQPDSLGYYLEQAARNNPQINSDFMLYKASLEKIPQAGAFPDPELEIGFFFKPMETLMGKQVADFTLMQMFPWFGTRKAARSEASEMARMTYEKFRDSRNTLWYEVKAQWYQLTNLSEQYKTTENNIALLKQLEQLALNRFSAPSAQGAQSSVSALSSSSVSSSSSTSGKSMSGQPSSGTGMSGMSGMSSSSSGANAISSSATPASSATNGMSGMGTGSMSAVSGGMSDVLRIQMERAELEDNLKNIGSLRLVAEAQFNSLLNRPSGTPVAVPDSLEQLVFHWDEQQLMDSIFTRNPMLTMIDAEADAYRAKAKMDRRMSYPMIGIGLQYSLINKMDHPIGMADMNGKDMVMPMVKISLPLFRRKYNAQQRESENYWRASELKRDNVQNQLHTEYISTRQQLEDAARKLALYSSQYDLSLSTWQLIVREFSAGRQSLTDVIEVERQMLDYKLKKSEAVAAYNTSIAAIEKLISTSITLDNK